MSEHKYSGTESDFHHGIVNASGNDVQGGQNAGNFAKLDGVKINFDKFYMHFKYVVLKDLIQNQINQLTETQG